MQLANKIIILEEQIDDLVSERLKEMQELENIHKQDLEMTRIGNKQREKQILTKM